MATIDLSQFYELADLFLGEIPIKKLYEQEVCSTATTGYGAYSSIHFECLADTCFCRGKYSDQDCFPHQILELIRVWDKDGNRTCAKNALLQMESFW